MTTTNEPLDLDELERIASAATQGAWTAYETMQADNFVHSGGGPLTGTVIAGPTYERANTAYIAAFDPPTVLGLIAAARRSVVSTPSDEVLAILKRALETEVRPDHLYEAVHKLVAGITDAAVALEASAVSAPPTITDEREVI